MLQVRTFISRTFCARVICALPQGLSVHHRCLRSVGAEKFLGCSNGDESATNKCSSTMGKFMFRDFPFDSPMIHHLGGAEMVTSSQTKMTGFGPPLVLNDLQQQYL